MDQDLVGVAITLEDIQRQALVIHIKAAGVILIGVTVATRVMDTVTQDIPTHRINAESNGSVHEIGPFSFFRRILCIQVIFRFIVDLLDLVIHPWVTAIQLGVSQGTPATTVTMASTPLVAQFRIKV